MSPHTDTPAQGLPQFCIDVLDQALALVALHEAPGAPDYAMPVGAHLRHVIEHCEALVFPKEPGVTDYDQRPRDRELESQPAAARARLQALQLSLLTWTDTQLAAPRQVRGLAGLAGDFGFAVQSTGARELVFVASHAIHHFALLQAHCRQQSLPVDAQFGRAPATAAHERAVPPASSQSLLKDSACTA